MPATALTIERASGGDNHSAHRGEFQRGDVTDERRAATHRFIGLLGHLEVIRQRRSNLVASSAAGPSFIRTFRYALPLFLNLRQRRVRYYRQPQRIGQILR